MIFEKENNIGIRKRLEIGNGGLRDIGITVGVYQEWFKLGGGIGDS